MSGEHGWLSIGLANYVPADRKSIDVNVFDAIIDTIVDFVVTAKILIRTSNVKRPQLPQYSLIMILCACRRNGKFYNSHLFEQIQQRCIFARIIKLNFNM